MLGRVPLAGVVRVLPTPVRSRMAVVTHASSSFQESLRRGDPKLGLFLNSASPLAAEQLSNCGYDWLLIDLQHSPYSYHSLSSTIASIKNGPAKSFVRILGPNDTGGIQQALDLGVDGIIVPSVTCRGEVERAAYAAYYPPAGGRSIFYPMRPTVHMGLAAYLKSANDALMLGIQVETKACLDDLDNILSVPGVDIAFVGPMDLSFSLGLHDKYDLAGMFKSIELKDAFTKVVKACSEKGVIAGNYAFPADNVGPMLSQGFPFLAAGNDMQMLVDAAASNVKFCEEAARKHAKAWNRQKSAIVP